MAKMNGKDKKMKDHKEVPVNEELNNPAFEMDDEQEQDQEIKKNKGGMPTSNMKEESECEVDQEILEAKDKQIDELTDRVRRTMAEFDNYRKRTDKEKSQQYGMGEKNVLENLLPVVDNLERALSSVSEEERVKSFVTGIDMIYKQLMTTMESLGVKEIEAVGKPFDPNIHNAVMHEENEDYGENIVVEQFLKGYMYKDTVLRYSMVKVAN